MKVEIKCVGASQAPIESLTPFQGDLKTLSDENYEKLKNEILTMGFSEPISVWENEGKLFLLNGHQRHTALTRMKEEGIEVPEVPINFIQALDENEAKQKILALTSQYGEMSEIGLRDFCNDIGFDFLELKERFVFPEINFNKKEPINKELKKEMFQDFKHQCPRCGFEYD